MRTRAERRAHHERVKAGFAKARGRSWYSKNLTSEEFQKHVARHAENRQKCSCWMCGNPRHYLGEVTMQEQRFFAGDWENERD